MKKKEVNEKEVNEKEVKIAVSIIDDASDFRVRDDGFLEGIAAKEQFKYRYFGLKEGLAAIISAGRIADKKNADRIKGVDTSDREAMEALFPMSEMAAVVALPLPLVLFDAFQEVEEKFLTPSTGQYLSCAACIKDGAAGQCPGVLHKGDLIKGILALAITIGLDTLLEMAANELSPHRPLSAQDLLERMMADAGMDPRGPKTMH